METTFVKTPGRDGETPGMSFLKSEQLRQAVEEVLASTPFIDIHTHLYSPSFGALGLWGIDELLTYHYLEAEFFRSSDTTPKQYWKFSRKEKADAIWQALFVENSPISEATRGVIGVLKAFGLPTGRDGLAEARAFFQAQSIETHTRNVLRLAGISSVVMTNDPLDPNEMPLWKNGARSDLQFHAVLRLDRILRGWASHWEVLRKEGYAVDAQASGKSISEIRRFLADWHERMRPLYMAVSLTDEFQYPEDSVGSKILSEAVLPSCREFNLP